HLAAGLGVLGAAGYAFVAVVGHVFHDPAEAGALSALISLYMLVNIIGPGVFAALEQETSRAVSAAAAHGQPLRPVARRAAVLAGWSFAGLVALVLVAWPLLLGRVLEWRPGLFVALLVAIAGSGAVYWARGVLGGQQRFAPYARTLYVEGAVRLLPCLVLLAVMWQEPVAYGLAFAIGSAVAALSVWPALKLPAADATTVPDGVGRSLLYLVGAIALSQVLANLAPVVATYCSPDYHDAASALCLEGDNHAPGVVSSRTADDLVSAAVFGSTFVLASVPLFLFAPVQAVLLPQVTRAAARGRYDELTRKLWQVLGLVAGLGLLGIGGCGWLGPWAAERLFHTAYRPPVGTPALLAAATPGRMLGRGVQPPLG